MMTPTQAEVLAERIIAAIEASEDDVPHERRGIDRDRVASDIAGLRECWQNGVIPMLHVLHAARYEAGLRRTADLYGVTG
jgi:hypothetical protein